MKRAASYLADDQVELLLGAVSNKKHITWLLLILDGGLKASEVAFLCYDQVDLRERTLHIPPPVSKKRVKESRTIPISSRLYKAMIDYMSTQHSRDRKYLFIGKEQHVSLKTIHKLCYNLREKYPTLHQLTPTALRNTFILRYLNTGIPLSYLKAIIGKENINTLARHLPSLEEVQVIKDISVQKNFLDRLKRWIEKSIHKPTQYIHYSYPATPIRQRELKQIHDLLHKNCNVLLLGPIGVGKSYLLQQVKLKDRKILYVDDCYEIKRTLVQCLLYLHQNNKEKCKAILNGPYEPDKLEQHLQRDSIPHLAKTIISLTSPHEYVLVIDNADHLTPKAAKALEMIKDHFTILTSARTIPLTKSSFSWNFQLIPIKNLSRRESIALIKQSSQGLSLEDIALYQNHIYHQTNGNPRAILELIDRYRKEPILSNEIVRSISHSHPRKEYDMSILIILMLTAISSLRYGELGDKRLRILGSIALLILIVFRYFFRTRKRNRDII